MSEMQRRCRRRMCRNDLPRCEGHLARWPARGRHRWRSALLGLHRCFLALLVRGRRSVRLSAGPRRSTSWSTHWRSVSKWPGRNWLHDIAVIFIRGGILTCPCGLHILQIDPRGVGSEVRVFLVRPRTIGREVDLGVLLLPPLFQLKQEKRKIMSG